MMNEDNSFRLQFLQQDEQMLLVLSDSVKKLNQRPLPAEIFKFMAAAQRQLDALFENHIPFNNKQT